MKPLAMLLGALLAGFAFAGSTAQAAPRVPATGTTAGELRRVSELQVAELAVRTHPAVRAARHAAVAAEGEHAAARYARLPELTVSARYSRLSSLPTRFRTLTLPGPDGSDASFVLPQILDGWATRAAAVLPLSDAWLSLAAAARAAGEAAAAQRLELEAVRARVAFEARAAYLAFRRAFGARRSAQAALTVATAQAREQQTRIAAGTAAPTSVLGFEAARYAARVRLAATQAELAVSEARLRGLLGEVSGGGALAPEGDLAPALQAGDGTSADHPAVRASYAAARSAEARAEAEGLALLPRLSAVLGAEVVAPSPRAFAVSKLVGVPAWDVTLQLEWSLSALLVGGARQSSRSAEHRGLLARAAEVRRQVETQRAAVLSEERSARERVLLAAAAARAATALARTRRDELAAGVATPLDLTTAEAERVRAELEQHDAELAWRLARAERDFVAGWSPRPRTVFRGER